MYVSACGYREYLSTVTNIYVSLLLLVIGPAKSIWTFSLGSDSNGNSTCLFFRMIGFGFSPVFVHFLNLCACATMSRWIWGYHTS